MAGLLADHQASEREHVIADIAAGTRSLLDPQMLRDGRRTFPQEAHVAVAQMTR